MQKISRHKQTDELLELLGSPIAYRSEFTRLPGVTVPGALFLSQALFWTKSPTAQARDGWFYKSQSGETDSWEAETGMTVKQQATARRSLKDIGVLEEVRKDVPAKVWYRVNCDRLYELITQSLGMEKQRKSPAVEQIRPNSESSIGETENQDSTKGEIMTSTKVDFFTEKTTEKTTEITPSSMTRDLDFDNNKPNGLKSSEFKANRTNKANRYRNFESNHITAAEARRRANSPVNQQSSRIIEVETADRKGVSSLISEQDVDFMFDALRQLYGAKFEHKWGKFDKSGLWMAEVAHLSRGHLELGVQRCRKAVKSAAREKQTSWPPQPAEFAAFCELCPEDLGIPDSAAAWHEACAYAYDPNRRGWSHEAVKLAGCAVGWWDLANVTSQKERLRLKGHFDKEYSALINRAITGERLKSQTLLEHDVARSPAEIAERAGHGAINRAVEAAGLPRSMSSEQGLAALRTEVNKPI
ncbi:hypothetical protein CZ787_13380 [Halomonas citrativorans]|uniref:Uncharacterized protein n=2 Tax=Halomonas citrativorans TaxID=2742612 RepID=A0A1R4I2Y7_9GAMM|nr:hypothetical protein CZ787_13380 [Halomonas citrativorans]